MSHKVYADELKAGHTATNCLTNELVELVGELTLDNGVEIWVVDTCDNGLQIVLSEHLIDPYYWR